MSWKYQVTANNSWSYLVSANNAWKYQVTSGGTYSSIYIASPITVDLLNRFGPKEIKGK